MEKMNKSENAAAASRMKLYGGFFAKNIGAAWFVADSENRKKLEEAFPELFQKYREQTDA